MSGPHNDKTQCHRVELPGAEAVNAAVWAEYQKVRKDPALRRTQYFAGRYENIYVDKERMPSLQPVFQEALKAACGILQQEQIELLFGFWFNEMGPGDVTLPHNHDVDGELLSAVYYIRVPEDSGQLILYEGLGRTIITPEEGVFVFFPPYVMHEVSENRSKELRVSIGINFGIRRRPQKIRRFRRIASYLKDVASKPLNQSLVA